MLISRTRHPNGWEGAQQAQMRKAAILGGLIPDTVDGNERIEFVTEGEASFHWCIDTGLASAALEVGSAPATGTTSTYKDFPRNRLVVRSSSWTPAAERSMCRHFKSSTDILYVFARPR